MVELPGASPLSPRAQRFLDLRRRLLAGDFQAVDAAIMAEHQAYVSGASDGAEGRVLVEFLARPGLGIGDRCDEWLAAFPRSYAAHWTCGAAWTRAGWQARSNKYIHEVQPAQILLMRERMSRAVGLLEPATRFGEKPAEALVALAEVRFMQGRSTEAEDLLRRAEKFSADYAPAHGLRVKFASSKWGGNQKAVAAAIARAEAAGLGEEYLLSLRDEYIAEPWRGRANGGEQAYWERVVAERPTFARRKNLAESNWRQSRWREMYELAEELVREAPDAPAMYYMRAVAAERLGKPDQALADYRSAVALGHNDAYDILIGAHIYGRLGLPAQDWEGVESVCRYGAALGIAPAANCVGAMFLEGGKASGAIGKDPLQALAWHRFAARAGNANSQHDLGWLLLSGRAPGVSRDHAQALGLFWLRRATEQGHELARRKLEQGGHALSEVR